MKLFFFKIQKIFLYKIMVMANKRRINMGEGIMRLQNIVIAMMIGIFLFGCSGKEATSVDTTPPTKPDLYEHFGETGDSAYVNEEYMLVTDANSGLSPVAEYNWLRLSWGNLIDNDIAMIRIYRYSDLDQTPILIDSVDTENDEYVDKFEDVSGSVTTTVWSYFIILQDLSGNRTVSDTVSFGLLDKPGLTFPTDESIKPLPSITDTLKFGFSRGNLSSETVRRFRVLLFDENKNLLWFRDIMNITEDENFVVDYPLNEATLTPGLYWWRVDALGSTTGNSVPFGSKSREFSFNLE